MNPPPADPASAGAEHDHFAMPPDYFRSIGHLEAQVQALTSAITELKTKVDGIDTRLADLDRLANKWRGGFGVVLVLGGVAGFVLDHLLRWIAPK